MNIEEILACLPHRFPLLLVDRIIELVPGKSCKGLKNVTINEPFFQGHYPGSPIMPGVLLIESMAQAGATILLSDPSFRGWVPIVGEIENVKFRRQVVPGDQLIMDLELLWYRNHAGRLAGQATVEGQLVASMELIFKLIRRENLDA